MISERIAVSWQMGKHHLCIEDQFLKRLAESFSNLSTLSLLLIKH